MRLSMTIGFITNSSSAIHHFPREVLDHPRVKGFLEAFEITGGFIGEDLWSRSHCTTVAITKEQKEEVQRRLNASEYTEYARAPAVDVDSDEIVVIYGDEYQSIASSLADLCAEALADIHGGKAWDYRYKSEYN